MSFITLSFCKLFYYCNSLPLVNIFFYLSVLSSSKDASELLTHKKAILIQGFGES